MTHAIHLNMCKYNYKHEVTLYTVYWGWFYWPKSFLRTDKILAEKLARVWCNKFGVMVVDKRGLKTDKI